MLTEQGEGRKMTPIDLNLDSTPIITWLAQARQAGNLDGPALRQSLIARMIWQVSYQSNTGLIENVAYLIGRRTWGENPRATLADDIWQLRHAFAKKRKRLTYNRKPGRRGFYIKGRPRLAPELERVIAQAFAEVNLARMAIFRKRTPAEKFAIAVKMTEGAFEGEAFRLRVRYPHLSKEEALRLVRSGADLSTLDVPAQSKAQGE